MAITYDWDVTSVTRDVSTGGITHIHWHCQAFENDKAVAAITGATAISYDADAEDFVAYENVTEEMVKGWLMATVDQNEVEETLAKKLAPPTTASGLPWSEA